jgi:beta-lactamase regulating signal transducer with metallopeptidase domain
MNWLGMQDIAKVLVERVLNSLPEGLLVALFAWLLLRLIGRQNAGTRFAVWFMALIAVVGLLFPTGFGMKHMLPILAMSHGNSQIVVPVGWAVVIFAVWALAAAAALARVAVGLWQVWTIRRSCTEVDLSQLEPEIKELFQTYSAGRVVRLAVSERVKVPAAIGFWKPAIMLPAWTLRELASNELKPILIHELTHLKRRDDWTNLLQKMVRAIFFFHPAVWWIDARLSLEREMACDDTVLAITGNPRAYASCLIELLEKSCARQGWTMAQAAVHRAQELSLRIAKILDAKRPVTTRVWKPALGLAGVFSLACFALSYCAPQLVAVGSNPSASAAHMTAIKTTLPASDVDRVSMPAAVIPASFHIPAAAPILKHPAVSRKVTKPHIPTQSAPARVVTQLQSQRAVPHMVMAKAVEATTGKHAVPAAQMVVFVETTEFGYGENLQTDADVWKTQVWHIVLIAPAAAQVGVTQSSI